MGTGSDLKVSDEFLDPLFRRFFGRLGLPNLMSKTDYHTLAPYVPIEQVHQEIVDVLNAIVNVARRARPRQR